MKNDSPLVSVIIPCYNHEKYIEECIYSVLNQTYKNIELLVIDDGSIDSSPQIIKKLATENNFYFESQINQGVSKTLNRAIELATSNLVCIISSDDIFCDTAVQVFVNKVISQKYIFSVLFGDSYYINENSEHIYINSKKEPIYSFNNIYPCFDTFLDYYFYYRKELLNINYIGSYASILEGNYIPVGIMLNKTLLKDVGGWDDGMKMEDYDLWLRMSKKLKFIYVHEVVSQYRLHATSTTKTNKDQLYLDLMKNLKREHDYALESGTYNVWKKKYNSTLLYFLEKKDYKLFVHYYTANSSFIYFIFKKIFSRIILKIVDLLK